MNKITINDLPENYQQLAEVIGIEKAMELSKVYGGTTPYIPKLEEIQRRFRNQKIVAEFNGSNYSALCIKYNLSEQHLRNIVRDTHKQPSVEDFLKEGGESK